MERAAFTIYLIILILSILLFGAVHTYAYTLTGLGVLAATFLLVIRNIRKDHRSGRYRVRFPKTGPNLLFLLILAFLFLQLVPLPDFFLEFFSPEAAMVAGKSLPTSSALGSGNLDKVWFRLAPYAYPVRMSIILWTVYGLFFLGLIQVLNSKKRIDLAIFLILITGCFEALYGLIQTYSGSEQIWWVNKLSYRGDVSGTYINRNHFAGFMGMGILTAAAFTGALSPRGKKNRVSSGQKRSLRVRISEAFSAEEGLTKRILILFLGVVVGIGLIFSASRGGMIATGGAMFLMGFLYTLRKDYRRKGLVLLSLFLLIAIYAIKIGVEYPMGRFGSFHSTYESRARLAEKTIDMFADYKLMGVGVGNFQYAYPKYLAPEDQGLYFYHAHNDWAQFLSEAGIIGLCLLLGGICYFVFRTMKLWKRRKDPYAVCLGVLPVVVLADMAVHSYSDFNLHIPANFMILVALIAIGYAALHLERHRRRDRMSYRYYHLPLKYRGGVVLVLVLVLIGWSGFWTIKHFVAEAYCNTVLNSTMNRDMDPPIEEIRGAIAWDRSNAEYWYKLALKLMVPEISELSADSADLRRLEADGSSKLKDESSPVPFSEATGQANGEGRDAGIAEQQVANYVQQAMMFFPGTDLPKIVEALEEAVRLNPFNMQYHQLLGWAYANLWNDPNYRDKWLPAADVSMDRAGFFGRENDPQLHLQLGNYWVMRSKSVLPNDPVHHEAWEKARMHYGRAIKIEGGGQEKTGVGGLKSEVRGQGSGKVGVKKKESKALKRMRKQIWEYVWNFYPDPQITQIFAD